MQTCPGIAALVPRRLWIDDFRDEVRVCRGTILFADIAGFTKLTETAKRRSGTRGIEQLTSRINTVFSDLVEAAHQSGGDVLKFGGDAVLVAFDSTESDQQSVLAALHSACAMEQTMVRHRRTTLRALSLHLGLAQGKWHEFVAGIPGTRREHFVWGDAITRAMHAADSASTRARIDCALSLLPTHGVLRFERVARRLFEFSPCADKDAPVAAGMSVPPTNVTHLLDFVAEGLRDDANFTTFEPEQSAEHRSVTTLFGFWSCPRELSEPSKGAMLVRRVFETTYQSALKNDGLWARSDPSGDKQKLLILFGATRSSTDDTDRALQVARTLQSEFANLRNEHAGLGLGVGVATAMVFTGFVGHEIRHEFTAMGDGVNLAARLAAKSRRNAILVDGATRRASARFAFRSAGTLALKNVRKPTAVFVPFDEIDPIATSVHDEVIEHPLAMKECLSQWDAGAACIRLAARPGTNHRKFTAQLLSRIEVRGANLLRIAFETADATHPLGGVRRICAAFLPESVGGMTTPDLNTLADMLDASGSWVTRSLARVGPDAAALAVAREIARRALPHVLVVLENADVLGEFDNRVLSTIIAQHGPRWLVISHSEAALAIANDTQPTVRLDAVSRYELKLVIGDLLAPANPSKPLLDFLFERSHGMPRLSCSLALHLIAQGAATRSSGRHAIWQLRSTENLDLPNDLRAQYLQHVDRLPKGDQHVLRAVSVLGESAPFTAVKLLCNEMTERDLDASLAQLQHHGLVSLQSQSGDIRITVDDSTCRQAVYETMSHQLRESWHRVAAAFWQSQTLPDSARIGEHLFRARDTESARWLRKAAGQARRFWSLDRSLRFTRWAILAMRGRCEPEYAEMCPPISGELSKPLTELYRNLSEILQLQGRHAESGRVERMLAVHAAQCGDHRSACRHRISAARMELLIGRYQHSQSQARAVLKQSRRLKDKLLRAHATYLLGETYRRSGRVELSLRALIEAESLAQQGDDHSLHADIQNALGLLHWNCGRLNEARQCFELSLRHLPRQADHARRGQVSNNLGILTEEQGRLRIAERFYQKAFDVFDRSGVRRHRAYSLGNLANLHRHAARYERAREAYEEVEAELLAMGEAHAAAYTVGNIGDLERDFGDWESARRRYEVTLEFARKAGDEELKAECYARIAQLHLLSGRLDLMPRMLNKSRAAAASAESREFSLHAELLRAEWEIQRGQLKSARTRIKSALYDAGQVRLVYYQLWAEHASIRMDLAEGNCTIASRKCRKGMAKSRTSGYTWWELRFAVLGTDDAMRPPCQLHCRERVASLLTDIEAGIGDAAIRAQFTKLPIVHDAHFANANPGTQETRRLE